MPLTAAARVDRMISVHRPSTLAEPADLQVVRIKARPVTSNPPRLRPCVPDQATPSPDPSR